MARLALDRDIKRLKLKSVAFTDVIVHEWTASYSKGPDHLLTGNMRADAPSEATIVSRFFAAPGGAGIEADLGEIALNELMAYFRPGPGTSFEP
ncbi:MAG: hypothetical protein ABL866_08995 [Devosia sp.]